MNESSRPELPELPEQNIFQAPESPDTDSLRQDNGPDGRTVAKHLGLFLLTVITVSFAGAGFVGFEPNLFPILFPGMDDFLRGLLFAVLLLGFLGVHEFGHYFAALYHRVKVTLPYFIPIPLGIGTLGAVIRIRQKINDTRKLFDIGVAGPLAGFIVSLAILLYGFSTLPGPEYIMQFTGHEEVQRYVSEHGVFPEQPPEAEAGTTLIIGDTLLYTFMAGFFENVPPMWEMYHYPFLFAGWLGLFFTALNLVPVGQLDGGHILYSLIGFRKQRLVARLFFSGLTVLAGIESIPFIHITLGEWDAASGALSWLIWALVLFLLLRRAFHGEHRWIAPVLGLSLLLSAAWLYLAVGELSSTSSLIWIFWCFFIAFFVGIEHPPAAHERPLDPMRRTLGWFSMAILVLCISPNPIYFI